MMAGKSATLIIASLMLALSGCRLGGYITGNPPEPPPIVPDVSSPTIVFPSSETYISRDTTLTIQGMCQVGHQVEVRGAQSATFICNEPNYTFPVTKNTDGIYAFAINQVDPQNNVSKVAPLTWIRKTSIAKPRCSRPS